MVKILLHCLIMLIACIPATIILPFYLCDGAITTLHFLEELKLKWIVQDAFEYYEDINNAIGKYI